MRLISFDIGGTSVKYGIVHSDGTVTETGSFLTPATLEELLNQISDVFAMLHADACAISSPGAVDPCTGLIHGISAVPYLHGPNIRSLISERIQAPVEIENDGNCAALAELWLGEAADCRDCCSVVFGTGVGGAVIKNRQIHRGFNQCSGEFGLILTDRSLDDGTCHIWSHYSTVHTVNNAERELNLPKGSLHATELFNHPETNPVYEKHVRWFYEAAAVGVLTIQQVYDPERIILGGGISSRGDFIDRLYQTVDQVIHSCNNILNRPTLRTCRFQNQANLIGAAWHFRKQQESIL